MTARSSRFASGLLVLVRVGAIAVLLGVVGYRLGVVGLGPAFGLFGVGLLISAATLPVDLRSVSRIGGGDVGTNAARIRAFAGRLDDAE